jgi:hypothetical protein
MAEAGSISLEAVVGQIDGDDILGSSGLVREHHAAPASHTNFQGAVADWICGKHLWLQKDKTSSRQQQWAVARGAKVEEALAALLEQCDGAPAVPPGGHQRRAPPLCPVPHPVHSEQGHCDGGGRRDASGAARLGTNRGQVSVF